MNKITIVFYIIILSALNTINAQEVGVRFGSVTGGNVAVDAIFSTGEFSRIHGDLSFGNGMGIDLLWDFLYQPIANEDFNWYVGVGPYTFIGDPFALGAVGEVGIEYIFEDVPISLSADWRPYFRLIDNTDFGVLNFGLNARWIF